MITAVQTRRTASIGRTLRRGLLPLLLGALLGGCATLTPALPAPSLPVAATYPVDVAGDQSVAAGRVVGIWREYFTDPGLQRLIEQALDHNRDVRVAALRVEEARAAYRIQRADRFPTIGLGIDGSRARVPGDINGTGQSAVGSQYQVAAGVAAWELDFWGRVRSLKDAALENFLATESARRAVRLSLITQVADAYLGLRELDERIVLAQQTVASREQSFRIFRRRQEVGSISRLELTQVETLLYQAQSLVVQLAQARAQQLHALTLLVGTPVDIAPVTDGGDDRRLFGELQAGLPAELLNARPDIVAAEHQLKAAHANIGAARAAFFPRVTLTGAYGSASTELENLFDSGSRAWNFAPSVSLPIFDAGRNRAGLDLATVRRDLAVADYEKTVQTAFREVSDALSSRHWLAEQLRIQQATLTVQAERARLARLRYDNGAAAFLEVLDAQRDLLSAEQQLVQLRRALLSSRVGLYAALGGDAPDADSISQ